MNESKHRSEKNDSSNVGVHGRFVTTRWSLVANAAGNGDQAASKRALQDLCQDYWLPLYAYARRRMETERARDMTQEFFCVLLEKKYLESADENKGRFRAFLLTAFKRFLANQNDRENAAKRGGQVKTLSLDFADADSRVSIQPSDDITAEKVFERQWALTLLENVIQRMRENFASKGEDALEQFDALKPTIVGNSVRDYSELSQQLDVPADGLRVQVHRMRQKYRDTLRAEIAETVSSPDEIDDEIKRLFDVFG